MQPQGSLLFDAFAELRRRIRARPDTEFQQASLRAVIMLLVYVYFYYQFNFGQSDLDGVARHHILVLLGPALLLFSVAILIRVALDTNISPSRRMLGALIDLSSCSYFLYLSGESGAVLLAVYLWVTLGNGFRYGIKYLILSAALSIAGFSWVAWASPFWHQHTGIVVSMLLTLFLIPLYSAFLIRHLHGAIRRANEASQAKSMFLANMSHELRTPLNGVVGIAELLRETPLNKEQHELVQAVHTSAGVLHKLIENVLDIARIESGKQTSIKEDYDLHQLLNATLLMMEPQAGKKGLLLATHIAPQTPYLLHGDAQHLRQVLINLVGNAIKFTEHGRVDVYVRPFLQQKQNWLRFEVVDSGIGIPAEMQGRIFESFTQADASITRRYGGTGLGTTISKQLIEMMGGRIGLTSQPEEGSTFWFEVPASEQDSKPAHLPGRLQVGLLARAELGYRLSEMMRGWHCQVQPMNAPAGAVLHLLSAPGATPDALIVERELLGTDPALFVRLLHDSPGLGQVQVILIDSEGMGQLDAAWEKAGYAAVLRAPVNPTLLFNALHEAASHKALPENVVSLAEHFQAKAGRVRLRVLVAEDNPVNQRVMRGLLEHAGHEVIMAGDGEEALSLLEANAGKLGLAIMDMHMPSLSGPDTVKRWRFMEQGHLPIIMLTADARNEAEQQCRDAGADDFLSKPVNSRALLEKIALLTQRASGGDAHVSEARQQPSAQILEETVLLDLAEVGGGIEFVRDLVEDFRKDGARAIDAVRQALVQQNYGAWKDQLHMLKGGASDVGAQAMAEACAMAERIKPFEITMPIAAECLEQVASAQQNALMALDDFLARQRNALGM